MVTQLLVARGMPKASQADARYTPAGGRERCGGCRHFMAPSVCNRILGPVTAVGWCRYYSQKPPQRAANFPGMGPSGMSLDLNFMQPGLLDPRITFTRASGGTYFDSTGTMRNAATNMWLQSADASNAAWVKLGNTSAAPVVTANQTTAPDGTLTAARVVLPAVSVAGSQSLLYQVPATTNAPYTFSVYLKGSIGGEQTYVGINVASIYWRQRVVLTTVWQRFSVTAPAETFGNLVCDVGTDLGDAGQTSTPAQTIFVWGGQVELGSTASPYIPTTTAPNGAPRWDYNPSTHALNGLLIEEARTNIALQSGDYSNAVAWQANNATVTGNQAVAPDGTMTAARIALNAVNTAGTYTSVNQTMNVTAAVYTFSVWLRGSVGGEQLYLSSTPNGVQYAETARIILTTSWQRYSLTTGTLLAQPWSFVTGVDMRDPLQGSILAQTIYAWGAQIEQGAFPTSYIPTTAAAVTRAADSCVIPPASMGFYTPPGGSWMAEFISQTPLGGNQYIVTYAVASKIPLYLAGGGNAAQYDGIAVGTGNVITVGALGKAASAWLSNTARACLNGGAVASSGALTTGYSDAGTVGITLLQLSGQAPSSMTGYIRRLCYWPRVLTNAEMQAVTT